MRHKLISAQDLCIGYKGRNAILGPVSFDLYSDDFVGIVGPNGGGKTTLIRTLIGLLKPKSGELLFPQGSKPSIGYMPQQNRIDKKFPISVYEVIDSGLMNVPESKGQVQKQERVEEILSLIELERYKHTTIGELSGGQIQRVLLGRAIVSNPTLLVLDEPNSYVDKDFEEKLVQLLPEISKERTILMVSHDIQSIQKLANRIFEVNRQLRETENRRIPTGL